MAHLRPDRAPIGAVDPLHAALRSLVRDVLREELAALSRPRFARLAEVGLTPRQLPTLERDGVVFEKVGKFWTVDLATLDAYRARQRAGRDAQDAPARGDAPEDPALAAIDPDIRARFERAARGDR